MNDKPKAYEFNKTGIKVLVQTEKGGAMMVCYATGAPEPLMRYYESGEYGGQMTPEKAEKIADDAEKEIQRRFKEGWNSEPQT